MKKIFAVAAIIISSHSFAQQDSASLNEVIVTANKLPQKQNQTGKVVTVITREVLSKSIGRTLPELLNQQAGLTVLGSQNNLGTNHDVFLQGASSGKTLILIDGVPAYDPSTISTAFDLNHFSIDNIERVEIVRGAMSTLYGSDAVAGVINIITRKGDNKPASFYATAAAGSFNTFKGVAGINGTLKKTNYNFQYSRLQSKGFSSAHDSTKSKIFDNDAFEQNVVTANIRTAITNKLSLKLNGQFGKYDADLDAGAFTDDKDYTSSSRNIQAGAGLVYLYGKGKIVFNYNFNNTKRNYLDDSTDATGFAKYTQQEYTGRFHIAEAYTNIPVNKHLELLIGTDYRLQNTDQDFLSISSFGPYESKRGMDSTTMNQYSFYASAFLKEMNGFHLELGGRYNNHSEYGNNFTYSFNPSYLINNKVKLFANIASAFKAPSLYQLFVINNGAAPLKAETSRTIDGGIEYRNTATGLFARALYFTRRIENGIDYSFVTYTYFNHNLQRDKGAELEAGANLGNLSIRANYTYITGNVNTLWYEYDPTTWGYKVVGDTTFNNLFRRPEHTGNANVGFQATNKLFFSTHARFSGKRWEPTFMNAPIELKAYTTIDFYTEYKVNEKFKAFADLKNITNERFFDIRGFNSRRFNFMAGINVNL